MVEREVKEMDSISEAREFNVNYNKKDNGEIDIIIEKTANEDKKTLVNAHFSCVDSVYILNKILKAFTS